MPEGEKVDRSLFSPIQLPVRILSIKECIVHSIWGIPGLQNEKSLFGVTIWQGLALYLTVKCNYALDQSYHWSNQIRYHVLWKSITAHAPIRHALVLSLVHATSCLHSTHVLQISYYDINIPFMKLANHLAAIFTDQSNTCVEKVPHPKMCNWPITTHIRLQKDCAIIIIRFKKVAQYILWTHVLQLTWLFGARVSTAQLAS